RNPSPHFSYSLVTLTGMRADDSRCTRMPYLPLCGCDPALMGGAHGLPGIRARFNPRMFRYASQLVGEVLSREIQHARLPEIIQATQPLLDGRLVLHNGYIARYRCPQRVVIIAKSPNRLLLQLQNYDVGINANVAGYINMMIPMVAGVVVPSGLLRIDVHGMVLEVEISVERGFHGPKITVASCSNFIDRVDISIEAKDRDGDNRHALLRRFVSKLIRDMLPKEICRMVPEIVNRQIVTRFASLPQVVALKQVAAVTGLGLFSSAKPDPVFCAKECGLALSAQSPKVVVARSIPTAGNKTKSIHSNRTRNSLCSQCADADESASALKGFTKDLDMKKLEDLLVSVKMINDYASDDGFAFDLTGEFSPNGQGGTPFGPFPVLFPARRNNHMLEAIVSDYTINTLLYWAYRKDFIKFRVGPDTPKVGDLLKTTCSDDDDEDIQLRKKREVQPINCHNRFDRVVKFTQLGDEWAVNEAVDFAPAFELESDLPEVKLFGKWNLQEVNVADISLVDYITVKEKYAKYLPHFAGRYQVGKDINIYVPICITTPCRCSSTPLSCRPREDSTRIGRAGTVRRQSVDVAPFRRVNRAMWLLDTGAHEAAFRNIKTIAECLADELINAAKESPNNYAIKKKDEPERVAQFNV
ncbi:hypothetical protein PRIPAC_79144, partial [Pristionchus pacificus]|uniref:Ribosomal protein n=1 Tax=Pristionchus pacificus TaxID=54126 RepID=A0A2A6CPY4_PRIPA